jgi:hypothetical protein
MTAFLSSGEAHDPCGHFPPRGAERPDAGGSIDFEAVLAEVRRTRCFAECGVDLDHRTVPRSAFCCAKHRYAFRDRRRYAEDPEGQRERARRYYVEHREQVLERAAARRGKKRPPRTDRLRRVRWRAHGAAARDVRVESLPGLQVQASSPGELRGAGGGEGGAPEGAQAGWRMSPLETVP